MQQATAPSATSIANEKNMTSSSITTLSIAWAKNWTDKIIARKPLPA